MQSFVKSQIKEAEQSAKSKQKLEIKKVVLIKKTINFFKDIEKRSPPTKTSSLTKSIVVTLPPSIKTCKSLEAEYLACREGSRREQFLRNFYKNLCIRRSLQKKKKSET